MWGVQSTWWPHPPLLLFLGSDLPKSSLSSHKPFLNRHTPHNSFSDHVVSSDRSSLRCHAAQRIKNHNLNSFNMFTCSIVFTSFIMFTSLTMFTSFAQNIKFLSVYMSFDLNEGSPELDSNCSDIDPYWQRSMCFTFVTLESWLIWFEDILAFVGMTLAGCGNQEWQHQPHNQQFLQLFNLFFSVHQMWDLSLT